MLSERFAMVDLYLIVKLDHIKQYVKINENTETYSFVDNINEGSLFECKYSDTLDYYLTKIRKENKGNTFASTRVSRQLLNEPLQNLIKVQKLPLD